MSLRAARSTAALTRVGPQCRRAVCTTASIRHDAYCVLPQLEHVKRKRLRVKMSVEAALGAMHEAPPIARATLREPPCAGCCCRWTICRSRAWSPTALPATLSD